MPADPTEALGGEQRAAEERPLIGKVIDQRYRVLAHIGSGGMADVYDVEHVALGRHLAMKVLRQSRSVNPQLVRRFSREARAASRIDSEHVVSIHDYGMLPEGNPYFVMDLLRGASLRSVLAREPRLAPARAVNLAIDVCLGLHAAHSAGLVHRDLKPENLWLARGDDGRELCVLLDFGVARFDGAHTTGDGVLVGTARYMSPEQIGAEDAPGPPSDLFSLGVLLYESLTGACPFAADSLERTLFRILNDTPRAIQDVNPDVSPELSRVIGKVLSKQPKDRYASALDLATALRPHAGAPRLLPSVAAPVGQNLSEETLAEEPIVTPRPYGMPTEGPPISERSRRAVLLSFATGLTVGGAVLFALRPTPQASDVAIGQSASLTTAPAAATAPVVAPISALPAGQPAASRAPTPVESSSAAALARPKPHVLPILPASASKPARPEPPRTNFDGRNPYLQ